MTKRMKLFGSFFVLCAWCSTGVLCDMYSILGFSPSSSEQKSSFQGSKADICNITINKVNQKCMCSVLSDTVDCSHMDIKDLPLDIKFPKTRRIISFRGNEIGSIQENTFYNGREVLDLDISNNQIDFISVNVFKDFETLIYLKLGHNRIWSVPLNVFEGLKNLLTLDLSHNELISLDPDIFKPLTNLRELRLKSNPLEHFEPQEFKHLQNLELLDLEATLLSIVPDEMFMFLTKLKFLSLANNRLFEVPTAALQSMNNLKVLDLSGNPIETIQSQAFFGLNKLSILYLDRMPVLSSIKEHAFADIKNLKELHCSYNFVLTEIHEDAFRDEKTKDVVAVDQLFLRQNDLGSIPEHLLQWTSTVELDIRENPLYCDCHAQWLLHLKLKTNFQNSVRCFGPNHLEDRLLSDLKVSEMICGLPSHMIIIVSCAVAAGILIIMLIIALFAWRRAYSGYRNVYYRVSKKPTSDDIVYQKGDDP